VFDSCICVDPDEVSQLLRRTKRTARKEHQCCECRCAIKPGERYELDVTVFEGFVEPHKTCRSCLRIRNSLFECGWYYGEIWERIHEAYCGGGVCVCPEPH
jgi:hypothetical protein